MKAQNVDIVKIRVDDNLGTRGEKMAPDVYRAVIKRSPQARATRVASHLFYLADAKSAHRCWCRFHCSQRA